jgi:hypothetical protein
MTALVAPLLWWLLTKSGGTHSARTIFDTDALVPLAFVEGLLLGLVPLAALRNLVVSALGFFRHAHQAIPSEPSKPPAPFLWMWVLPAIVFLVRFVGFDSGGAGSVLGGHAITVGRFAYFFGPLTPRALSGRATVWSTDRILITTPMLFTTAYRLGVRLSGCLPQRPLAKEVTYDEVPAPASADTLGS